MHQQSRKSILFIFILVLLLMVTACAKTTEKKVVAKLDIVEEDEESSGGLTVNIENPEDEEEKDDPEEKEDKTAGTETTESVKNLTVATYNIAAGKLVNFDYSLIASDIRNSGASVVALQEIDQDTLRNGCQDTMAILSEQTGMQYYCFAPALSPYQEGEYGIGILSKYPIESYIYMDLPKGSSNEEQRVLLHAELDIGGTALDFFVTHGQQSSIRQQLTAANDYISSSSKFIYAGDFNTATYDNYKLIGNSYTIIGHSNPILTSANYSFDNMVISNNIQSSNVRVIKTGHSDHYLLLANVAIPTDK